MTVVFLFRLQCVSPYGNVKHLGQTSQFPGRYSPEILEPIPRILARSALGIGEQPPFAGEDIWNAYELTWLNESGEPQSALLRFSAPSSSPNIVESKSIKLYLGSFTNERMASASVVARTIEQDLARVFGASLLHVDVSSASAPGEQWRTCHQFTSAPGKAFSHDLRSLCPVTSQPDYGTCVVYCSDLRLDNTWLARQVLDLRHHQGFHEELCERIYLRVVELFRPEALSVGCWYNRRGGIDINPIRRSPGLLQSDPLFLRYSRTLRQ